jgi:predicted enzyme related to lactoylglutathione lyase
MTAPARLGLVILAVGDLAETVRFYRDAFGWATTVEVPVYVELELPKGMALGLYEREAFGRNTSQVPAPTPPGALAPVELYLSVDDLPGCVDRVRAAGGRLLSDPAPRDWGDEVAYFADPAGNVVAVARRSQAPNRSSSTP